MKSVREFWDEQAAALGEDERATSPDAYYRQLEIGRIEKRLRGDSLLDVGCGNGFSTFRFEAAHRFELIRGIDFSAAMIEQACKRANEIKSKVGFAVFDVREAGNLVGKFDTIVSERCLINLPTWEEQLASIHQMRSLLNPGGRLVLAENFMDGLRNLNKLRASFDLPAISVRWHNRYLEAEEFLPAIHKDFTITYSENIGNLYYIISRVVHAKLAAQSGIEPAYDHPINHIASLLPSLGGYDYSPNMLYVLTPR